MNWGPIFVGGVILVGFVMIIWFKVISPMRQSMAGGGSATFGRKPMQQGSYPLHGMCNNCGAPLTIQIPFGVTIEEYFSHDRRCTQCGALVKNPKAKRKKK